MAFYVHAKTHVGKVRDHNEDAYFVEPQRGVYAVADGMGGHAAGDIASQTCVETLSSIYESTDRLDALRSEYIDAWRDRPYGQAASATEATLVHAIRLANLAIYQRGQRESDLQNMGTTFVGMAFQGRHVATAHVGDSRAYRLRSGRLKQLTEDHSLANEYLASGRLRPEDLASFPYHNVIVRALGLAPQVQVATSISTWLPGDRYLLCSDGLTDLVPHTELRELLMADPNPRAATENLVQRALTYGGIDNITAIVLDPILT